MSAATTAGRCCWSDWWCRFAGIFFGLVIMNQLKNLPVHRSMREISELIYETCKTYLITQGRFLMHPRGLHRHHHRLVFRRALGFRAPARRHHPALQRGRHPGQLRRGLVRHPGQHLRQLPDGLRQPPRACPHPVYAIPLKAGMSIGMLLISVELLIMLFILLFVPGDYAGPCFIGFAIGESLGAVGAAYRRRHLHQDRRHRLRPDEDRLQHQGRRRAQPRRHRRLHGRQRRRLGGPERRRLRDLRRDGRGADHVHHAGRDRAGQPGPPAGLDLRDAHDDGDRERRLLPDQRSDRQEPLRHRRRR